MRHLPGDGGGAGGFVHHGLAGEREGSPLGRRPAASGDVRAAVRGRQVRGDVRRMGRLRRRWRLQRLSAGGSRLGPRPAAGRSTSAGNDAKAYVAWLSRKTGKTYRLLSEAEREYVTRAGTTTPFWWESTISTSQANYDGNFTYGGGEGRIPATDVPVDSFQPTRGGSTRCTAMSGSGRRTAGTTATRRAD